MARPDEPAQRRRAAASAGRPVPEAAPEPPADQTADAPDDRPSTADAVETTVPAGAGAPPIPWRRNLYAIWAAQLLAIVGFSLRAPFLPFYLGELGVDTVGGQALWSGVINAAGAGVMAFAQPIWGEVADRRGRRTMLLRATLAATCTVSLMSLATHPWHLLALRVVEGALTGTVTAATALVATTTPKARLGYALGLIQTAVFAGASLGPLAGGLLADRIGPRPTFLVAGACLGGAALITLFLVRERFVPVPRAAGKGGSRAGFGVLAAAGLVGMVAVLFGVRLATMAVQPILPLFVGTLAPDATNPSSLAGLVLGVLGVTSAVSSVFLGRLGDRRGHRRILVWGVVAAGFLYLPMALAQTWWQLFLLQALFGVAAGGIVPAANALIANATPPERRGAVFGVTAGAASWGAFIGPLAGSALAAAVGFRAPFLATAVLLLALALVIARRRSGPGQEPRTT